MGLPGLEDVSTLRAAHTLTIDAHNLWRRNRETARWAGCAQRFQDLLEINLLALHVGQFSGFQEGQRSFFAGFARKVNDDRSDAVRHFLACFW